MDDYNVSEEQPKADMAIAAIVCQKPSGKLKKIRKNLDESQRRGARTRLSSDEIIDKDEKICNRYETINNTSYKKTKIRSKIVLPENVLSSFIAEVYDAHGHIGGQKLYKMISEHFLAPGLRK